MDEYISKGAMLKNLTTELEQHLGGGDPRTHFIMRRFIKYVKDFPAADVQPVRRGRWIWDSNAPYREHGAYKCSNCDGHSDFEENYCPNCGARMDGDTE